MDDMRDKVKAEIEARDKDPEYQARVAAILKREKAVFDALLKKP